jgi:hypothetical protein
MGFLFFFFKLYLFQKKLLLLDDFPTVHSFGVSLRYLSKVYFFQTLKAKRIHQIPVREAFNSALFIEGVLSNTKVLDVQHFIKV